MILFAKKSSPPSLKASEVRHPMMSRRTTALALCFVALGSPLVIGCSDLSGNIAISSADEKYKKGDYKGAISDLNKAITLDQQNPNIYNNRGLIKDEQLGDHQGAIADYSKVIEIDSRHASAYNDRGNRNSELGNYQAAIDDYNKAIQINPKLSAAYSNRAPAWVKLGNEQGAIADYNKAIEINPKNAYAYANRGIAKELVGDLQGACDDWSKASLLGYTDAAKLLRNQCQSKEISEDSKESKNNPSVWRKLRHILRVIRKAL